MKYPLSIALILVTAVTFLYFLFTNPNFLPVNEVGRYNWINIFTLIFLLSIALFTLSNLIAYLVQILIIKVSRKKEEKVSFSEEKDERVIQEKRDEEEKKKKEVILKSIKISTFVTIGTIAVFTLNYMHVLGWIWGIIILLVVLIFTFII